jgi:glyoxylase-like metal-dependent hydrolase (beta-lactamase superfamily II)
VTRGGRTIIRADDIRRLHFGYFVAPDGTPDSGQARPVTGFLIRHPGGLFLFDTGMSPWDEESDAIYQPRFTPADAVLRAAGVEPADIGAIANCHLHADHAGGNHHFPGIRVHVQEAELAVAGEPDFTYPEFTFAYPGAALEPISGEVDVAPGMRLVPTPGHTPGHQSLLVDTDAGRWLLAGQASDSAWAFSSHAFAERLRAEGLDAIGEHPAWIGHLRDWRVDRALFAHDLLVWERDSAQLGQPRRP